MTQANKLLNDFLKKGWLKSSLENYCYEKDKKSNIHINDLISMNRPKNIFSGYGEYLFVFEDKSGIYFDGSLYQDLDECRCGYVLSSYDYLKNME